MRVTGTWIIKNKLGIHARVAAKLVSVANKRDSEVFFTKGGQTVNAKNILDLLTLSCLQGSIVEMEIDGPDAELLLKDVEALAANKFGED